MDAKVGRLGGHAPARQGGRDQRALVQRAAPDAALARREPATHGAARIAARADRAARRRSTRGSGTPPGSATCTTWSTASAATIRRAGPTSCSRSRCPTPCSTRRAGRPVLDVVARRAAHAGRAALARAATIPTTSRRYFGDLLHARRRVPPGHGVELADRAVRRRRGCACTRTTARARARVLDGFERAPATRPASASISEVFDAEAPFTPRGCIAQAWGVAEVLRAWRKTLA